MGALALLAACVISPEQASSGPVICPFRIMTGLPCPGCGLTRGFVAAAHGDLGASVAFNPAAILVMLGIALLVGWRLASLATRRVARPDLALLARSRGPLAALGVWLAVASWRAVATQASLPGAWSG